MKPTTASSYDAEIRRQLDLLDFFGDEIDEYLDLEKYFDCVINPAYQECIRLPRTSVEGFESTICGQIARDIQHELSCAKETCENFDCEVDSEFFTLTQVSDAFFQPMLCEEVDPITTCKTGNFSTSAKAATFPPECDKDALYNCLRFFELDEAPSGDELIGSCSPEVNSEVGRYGCLKSECGNLECSQLGDDLFQLRQLSLEESCGKSFDLRESCETGQVVVASAMNNVNPGLTMSVAIATLLLRMIK